MQMEALEAILSRRSIRSFTEQPVEPELVDKILQAGFAAPSAHNEQPWHFVVIRDRKILEEIPRIHPYAQMLKEAPLAFCVCADLDQQQDTSADYWVQDCAAATENILLAAHSLGLGACWIGIHPRMPRKEALQKLLQLPANVVPFCCIALGYPGKKLPPSNRYQADRIHSDHW